MAPLSVQRTGEGTRTGTGALRVSSSRRAVLAATPPPRRVALTPSSRAAGPVLAPRPATPPRTREPRRHPRDRRPPFSEATGHWEGRRLEAAEAEVVGAAEPGAGQ